MSTIKGINNMTAKETTTNGELGFLGTEPVPAPSVTETTTEPVKEVSALASVMVDLAAKLNDGNVVRDKFLNLLVTRELDERVACLDAALKKRIDQDREVRKLNKPDHKVKDAKGNVIMEGFTEPKLKELNEAQDKLKKLDTALDLALSKNDFSKLKDLK
jgi:hypothetical protein